MKTKKRSIGVIILPVRIMRRAVRFYAALGLKPKFETPEFSEFHAGGVALALEARRAVPKQNGPAFAIQSFDIRRDISLFRKHGARTVRPLQKSPFGQFVIFADSEGNWFELVQYKK